MSPVQTGALCYTDGRGSPEPPPAGTEAHGVSSVWMAGGEAGQLQLGSQSGTGGHRRRRRMV